MREGQILLIALTSHEEQGSRTYVLWQPKYSYSSEVFLVGCWRIGYVTRSAIFYLFYVLVAGLFQYCEEEPSSTGWVSVAYRDMGAILDAPNISY